MRTPALCNDLGLPLPDSPADPFPDSPRVDQQWSRMTPGDARSPLRIMELEMVARDGIEPTTRDRRSRVAKENPGAWPGPLCVGNEPSPDKGNQVSGYDSGTSCTTAVAEQLFVVSLREISMVRS
jgi:hypothetical protein